MDGGSLPKVGIFIEDANDFSQRGVEEGCSSDHIKTSNFIAVNA